MEHRARRLNHAIAYRKVTKMAFLAHELNVDESAISRWRHGGTMSLANAAHLCAYLDISLDWLILDRGGIAAHRDFSPSPAERDLLATLRTLPPASVELLRRFLAAVVERA